MALNVQQSIFSELADFIVSLPSLEAIIAYRVPEDVEERVHDLLEKNCEEGLTPEEREEMDKFMWASHLMTLAKAKARLRLANEK